VVGELITHFRIVEKIGEGGMGVVYKAADIKLERTVALKFVAPSLLREPEIRKRFEREAKAAASLSHPNICTVYEIDESDRGLFIAMEFIDGESLDHKIHRGPLPLDQALDIACQVTQGLSVAHQKGMIHRDIKPQNVMITQDGRAVILDFGLAQFTGYSRLTTPGATAGTITYMSPEQTQGAGTDARTDIWSVGVMLYEMITGRLPFVGDYPEAVVYSILNEEQPPITGVRAGVPLKLEWVVGKCLAKQRADRYPHSEDLLTDLRVARKEDDLAKPGKPLSDRSGQRSGAVTAGIAQSDPSDTVLGGRHAGSGGTAVLAAETKTASGEQAGDGKRGARNAWRLGALLGLLVVLSSLAFLWWRAPQPPQELPLRLFSITPESLSPGEYTHNVAISPNGRYIAYLTGSPANYEIWLHDIAKDAARKIQAVHDFPRHFWSPDSRFVAFQSDGELKTFSVDSGQFRTICRVPPRFGGGAWSPDGNEIVFAASVPDATDSASESGFRDQSVQFGVWSLFETAGVYQLYGVAAQGGTPQALLTQQAPEGRRVILQPHFLQSPDERRLLLYVAATNTAKGSIVLWNLDNGEERDLGAGFFPVYSPSGHILYQPTFDGDSIWAVPFSIDKLRVAGEPFLVGQPARFPTVSSGGTLAYFENSWEGQQQLVWRDRNGRKVGDIGLPQRRISLPSLSPDGRLVGVEGTEDVTGVDVWLHDVDRQVKTRLTLDPARDSRCVWSPDGRKIVFWSSRNGGIDMFIKNADGSGEEQSLLASPLEEWPGTWSPDGKCLLFAQQGELQCLELDRDGNQVGRSVYLRTPFMLQGTQFSPNGQFVAYCSEESGERQVYVRSFQDGRAKWQISLGGGQQPRWSRDGKEIFYVQRQTLFSVRVKSESTFSVGQPAELFSDPGLEWPFPQPTFDVSLDGQKFVTIETIGKISRPRIRVALNWFEGFRATTSPVGSGQAR
jgi:serine/threonine protein kinase/WD40 repeat protein